MNKGDLCKYKGEIYYLEEDLGEGFLLITRKLGKDEKDEPFQTLLPGVQKIKSLVVIKDLVEEASSD